MVIVHEICGNDYYCMVIVHARGRYVGMIIIVW